MKKTLLYLFFYFIFLFPLFSFENESIPKKFRIQYQLLSKGTFFHVIQDEEKKPFAKILRETGALEKLFFLNLDDRLIALAEIQKNASTTTTIVRNGNGEEIGWFAAFIPNLYPSQFKLYENSNRLIATGTMNWVGSRFTLADPENPHRVYAVFTRPRFKLHSDSWQVEISKECAIDPILFVIIAAFQTSLNLGLEG